MSQQIAVVAIVDSQPGTTHEIEAAMRTCILATRAESGCLSYVAHRDTQAPNRHVFVELWESQAALDAHMQTPHLQAIGAAFAALGASLEIITLQPIDE